MNADGDSVVDVDPLTDRRWLQLPRPQAGSLFSAPRWLRLLADVYGFDVRARIIDGTAGPRAGFAYAHIDDVRGPRTVSLPFCDIADPVVETHADWVALGGGLIGPEPAMFGTRSAPVLCADPRLVSTRIGVWHEVGTVTPPDELLSTFAQLPRRMIRRSARAGLSIDVSTSRRDLRSFFDLHVAVRKYRHGLLAQPFAFFDALADTFLDTGNGVLINARNNGAYAGGAIVLHDGDTAFYKFAASHPDHRQQGVNHAVVFAALGHAHRLGFRALDLGRSDDSGPGLIEFKRRFRPLEQEVTKHVYLPPGLPNRSMDTTLDTLTRVLVRPSVPDSVTAEAGGLLYKFFA